MYIIGQTGTGKSTLLMNMLASDIRQGEGLALIDPHGDLASAALDLVPEARMEEVVFFNPADIRYPIAFNPLEKVHPDSRYLVVSGLISVCKKLWPDAWGPRLEHILRYTLLTLMEYPGGTLLDVSKILTDSGFRSEVLEHVRDQQIREFWFSEFNKLPPPSRVSSIAPVLNKTGQFLASVVIRNIVGQSQNSFDVRKVMDEGKILVVSLSKGKIGEDSCALLGALIVNKIMLAAMSRSDTPEEERRPFHLYVDEVHNFLTPAFAGLLSESRKYGLDLVLAHQYIEQLDKEVRSAVFGNAGTLISFRLGIQDAAVMAKEFFPVFDQCDLIGLSNHHIYLKLMIDGKTSQPFSAITLPPPKAWNPIRREIAEFSRLKYGRPRNEVESQITDARSAWL